MKSNGREGFRIYHYILMGAALLLTMTLCLCLGKASIPLRDTARTVWNALRGVMPAKEDIFGQVIVYSRLPRVLRATLCGAALSLCGAAMQGLLRNPMADGSTMGVSSGAALGAMLALLTGFYLPGFPLGGTAVLAMVFAFLSLILILGLAFALDRSLSTYTIILIGVIFSMFASSLMSLMIAFAGERVRTLTFWTMGSLDANGYEHVALLLGALAVFGGILLALSRELNAFAVGEENARHIGVNVRGVKLLVLVCVSALIGVCVAVGGVIGFVGLVVPHMTRMLTGPNHRRLLPASMAGGSVFLLLADLAARTLLPHRELPIGAVTSLVGAAVFVLIFFRSRKAGRGVC